jgi:superoxide dismutase, Cu-Zn family
LIRAAAFLAAGLLAIASAGLAGCTTIGSIPTARISSYTLKASSGLPAGTATITAARNGLSIRVAVVGLPEGAHGLHLHTVGKCEGPAFTSAGGHLNPAGHLHGTSNPAGSHLGDLPNIVIEQNGAGALSVELRGSLDELEALLFDADGSALVIHAAPDDYKTDPTGNSGARIACGVIERR